MQSKFQIPKEVAEIVSVLMKAGHRAYIVGGCVRDLLLGREPKDWDIATRAKPDEIQRLFPESVYENEFGTVAVKTATRGTTQIDTRNNAEKTSPRKSALDIIEVTTFRKEEKYSDLRHPDKIEFAKTIEEDLARRDFTINAIALGLQSAKRKEQSVNDSQLAISDLLIIDLYGGQEDLKKRQIKAVGQPYIRFNEDALRLIRAVRFAAELGFIIEEKTVAAIKENAQLLDKIAKERVRDEFVKIIMSPAPLRPAAAKALAGRQGFEGQVSGPYQGVLQLEELGLLEYVIPELREGIGTGQNKHHIYTVWKHNLLALDYAASKDYSLEIRLASLLHDVGKPRTKEGDGPNSTFYNHEVVGAKMTKAILTRLHFSNKEIQKVTHLVRTHLFYYNVGEVTAAGVRRFLARVGEENVEDLLKVREADRIGSGVPKAFPYKLRHLKFMIEKVKADPISPKMLAVKGGEVIEILNISPGPRIGWILNILLEEVLDDPARNRREYLVSRIKELGQLSDNELKKIAEGSKKRKEEFESGIEEEMKKKYYVR